MTIDRQLLPFGTEYAMLMALTLRSPTIMQTATPQQDTFGVFLSAEGQQIVFDNYDKALSAWPVPHSTRFVATRHGQTHVIECGRADGPPLVMLHGHNVNATVWRYYTAHFADTHHLYLIDLIGQPGKSAPTITADRFGGYVDWLDDVLTALNVQQTALMGLSLGGCVALQFALKRAARVSRVLVFAPAGVVPLRRLHLLLLALPALSKKTDGVVEFARRISRNALDEALLRNFADMLQHTARQEVVFPILSDADLASFKMPLFIISPEHDDFFGNRPMAARFATGQFPHVTFKTLPNAAHVFTIAQLGPLMAECQAFLRGG
jgi:pimeloyl-ACP methyl ester carboxylesterase